MSGAHVHFFFTLRDNIKLYHWNTISHARHRATDDIIKQLDEHIDLFVEVWMGKYGRPRLTSSTNSVKIRQLNDKSSIPFVKEGIAYLQGPLTKSLKGNDTDLMNIRDEILANLNQLLYLFTLQ
uniref:Uncharacterized protein n=1 Tax=viral metagenome TaxID=1070528 RepID=A0A6C0DQ36_9ZZZZ